MLFMCCVCHAFARLSIAAVWSSAGKELTSWLLFVIFNCVFVIFPCGILGQVRYLIVSMPDLCPLSYFYTCGYFIIYKQFKVWFKTKTRKAEKHKTG